MGNVRKVLSATELEPRTITAGGLWTDLCEDIHLHYRNVRVDFSEDEWASMRAAINGCGLSMEEAAVAKNYREGDFRFLMQFLFNPGVRPNSDYYPNRFLIELQRDNTVHVHYRDIRLHLTLKEFKDIYYAFEGAFGALRNLKEFPYQDIEKPFQTWVDIDLIQPYDDSHRCMAIDQEHRDGIEYCKGLIKEKARMRPILVNTDGQRLDGFKRYMAHYELGIKRIECIIDPYGVPGGQHNQSMIAD